jgi:hypothetical protein
MAKRETTWRKAVEVKLPKGQKPSEGKRDKPRSVTYNY